MGRLKAWLWFVVATAFAEVALSLMSLQRLDAVKRAFSTAMADPTEQAIATVNRAAAASDALVLPVLVGVGLSLVAIIGWMHSGARVVADGNLGLLRHSTGWAIGAWFVPFLNLVRVPQIAADLYRAGRTSPRAGLVIGGWWILWLFDSIYSRGVSHQPEPRTPADAIAALDTIGGSYYLSIGSAVATVVMVWIVTTGLASADARPRTPIMEAVAMGVGAWGAPAPAGAATFGMAPAALDSRFGSVPASVEDSRFASPQAPVPDGWLAAPMPIGPPAGPPRPFEPPRDASRPAAEGASPTAPQLAPEPNPRSPSPYPSAGTFFPE